jgi:hypothetical protein
LNFIQIYSNLFGRASNLSKFIQIYFGVHADLGEIYFRFISDLFGISEGGPGEPSNSWAVPVSPEIAQLIAQ